MCFLLNGQVKTRFDVGWKKNTQQHPRFCLDWNLDTDDFANPGLFIKEVSCLYQQLKLNTPVKWRRDCGWLRVCFEISMIRQREAL